MNTSGPILLYDGFCNLCNGIALFIIRKDSSSIIKFASLKSPAGESLLKQFGLTTEYTDSLVYITGNKYFIKSAAALHVLRDLGGGWGLFYGLMLIPESFRDFIYTIIARYRYRIFGKRESCMVPSPEIEQRFLYRI